MSHIKSGSIMVAALVLATATACASPNPEAEEPDSGEVVSLEVGSIPGLPSQFLQFGIDQGYFLDEGLELSISLQQSGAATIPAVMGEHLDFGTSNVAAVIQARAQGLPIVVFGGGTISGDDPLNDLGAVVVPVDSPVQTLADLEGSTIAVNALGGIADLSIRIALEEQGVDPMAVNFFEIGFPDMVATLAADQVEAASLLEPFVSLAKNAGNRVIASGFYRPGLVIGSIFTSENYADANPDIVERFQRAVAVTTDAVNDDDGAAFREFLIGLKAFPAEVQDMVVISQFAAEVDEQTLTEISDAMTRFGFIDSPPSADEILWHP